LKLVSWAREVLPFRTAHVVFFLVAQHDHEELLCRARRAQTAWPATSNGISSTPVMGERR
jgi:hypothetical protein